MIQASQFVPISFGVTMVGFGLTKSVGRLAARLLTSYGDEIDDELGNHIEIQEPLQFVFRDRGLLTVTTFWTKFEGAFEPHPNSIHDPNLSPIYWAVELLSTVLTIQKQQPVNLKFEMTWLLDGHATTTALVDYLGMSKSLNGLFAASTDFEVSGNTTVQLSNLYLVECELTTGRLGDYTPPENVGIVMRYRSPDNRFGDSAPIDYTRAVIDQFFANTPLEMMKQLKSLFPVMDVS